MTPVRSCVGCGRRAPQRALLRFTWRDESLRFDGARRAGGRGAYLHDQAACWTAFCTRRGSVRSLRAAVPRPARERFVATLGDAVGVG